jgi:hypothetical protein
LGGATAVEREARKAEGTITEVKEFEGPHLLPSIDGWEEVADYALDWALGHARPTVPAQCDQDSPLAHPRPTAVVEPVGWLVRFVHALSDRARLPRRPPWAEAPRDRRTSRWVPPGDWGFVGGGQSGRERGWCYYLGVPEACTAKE